jgi:hypothetical protein
MVKSAHTGAGASTDQRATAAAYDAAEGCSAHCSPNASRRAATPSAMVPESDLLHVVPRHRLGNRGRPQQRPGG